MIQIHKKSPRALESLAPPVKSTRNRNCARVHACATGNWSAVNTKTRLHSSFLSSKMAFAKATCRASGFFVSVLAILLACSHLIEAGGKTLVLVDNANTKETHSIFFNSLKGKNELQQICKPSNNGQFLINMFHGVSTKKRNSFEKQFPLFFFSF